MHDEFKVSKSGKLTLKLEGDAYADGLALTAIQHHCRRIEELSRDKP